MSPHARNAGARTSSAPESIRTNSRQSVPEAVQAAGAVGATDIDMGMDTGMGPAGARVLDSDGGVGLDAQ
ncbi:MAG: hypothetical protein ACOX5Q_00850 [Bacillota bacterium]